MKNSIYILTSLLFQLEKQECLEDTSRREIGHGNLAQRALKNMIPDDNPYTIELFLIF